jgi:hypothetical protein
MVKGDSSIPGSKLHHRTVSAPIHGETSLNPNAVLLLSGKTGCAGGFLSESIASALLDKGPRLDASQYFPMHKDRAGAPASALSLTRHS